MKKIISTALICLLLTSCSTTTSTKDSSTTIENVDTVTIASITSNNSEFVNSLSSSGNWITCATDDINLEKDLTVSGKFFNKDDKTNNIYRKLALYTQDSDKNVTDSFTLTVPTIIVESENFRIQEGTVVGNIIVKANGFEIKNATIDGNISFDKGEYRESANLDNGTITGEVK